MGLKRALGILGTLGVLLFLSFFVEGHLQAVAVLQNPPQNVAVVPATSPKKTQP
jgi:hypothetical protein